MVRRKVTCITCNGRGKLFVEKKNSAGQKLSQKQQTCMDCLDRGYKYDGKA